VEARNRNVTGSGDSDQRSMKVRVGTDAAKRVFQKNARWKLKSATFHTTKRNLNAICKDVLLPPACCLEPVIVLMRVW
jgi:hypothetical protein